MDITGSICHMQYGRNFMKRVWLGYFEMWADGLSCVLLLHYCIRFFAT